MKHYGYTYQSLDNLDSVKNREYRYISPYNNICSMRLIIILRFENDEEFYYYCRFVDKQLDKS